MRNLSALKPELGLAMNRKPAYHAGTLKEKNDGQERTSIIPPKPSKNVRGKSAIRSW
jgi:hypothetical protein